MRRAKAPKAKRRRRKARARSDVEAGRHRDHSGLASALLSCFRRYLQALLERLCVIQRRERPLNARLEGPAGLRGAELGRFGERLAERFLVDRGLELLARNHSCRHGEADLVLRDGETLIFVEVKARASAGIDPAAAVDLRKQRRLQCAAQDFVLRARLHDPAWRYDIVAIEALADPPGLYALRWIPAAFDDPSL